MNGLRRPADLTIAQVGLLHVGFPLRTVQEVLTGTSVTPVPGADLGCAGLLNVRGEIMSVIDLAARLGVEPQPELGKPPSQVIVRTSRGQAAVTVDRVTDVAHVPADRFEVVDACPGDVFTGAYALPGRLVLVLDTDRVVWAEARPRAA